MSRLKVFLGILFVAILAPRIYIIIRSLDIGETVLPHAPGPCSIVKGIGTGSEDIHVIPGTDVAIITTGLRFGQKGRHAFPDRKGNIMFFNFNKPNDGAFPAKMKGFPSSANLNPHGLTIWAEKGKVILMVVNHEESGEVVERFEVDVNKYTLTHLESIREPEVFTLLNDVVATGERTFYFTNYAKYNPGTVMATLEMFIQLRYGFIGYYDGKKSHVLDSGLLLPNGINLSPDRKYLYVAHIGDEEIRTYEIKSSTSLQLVQQKKMETYVDNISVDPNNGDLWLGCHPVGWKILYHLENQKTTTAPSQVIRIITEQGLLTDDTREVYVDTGNTISASTVAVYHKSQLLIGSINHNTVYCQVKVF